MSSREPLRRRPTVPRFDQFAALDWSGAKGRYNGIAVAVCEPGNSPPRLVLPATGRRWSRTGAAGWLKDSIKRTHLLAGLDFGFGFPFEAGDGYLGGQVPDVDAIFALWSLIEQKSCTDADFGCSSFLSDAGLSNLFWRRGTRPDSWVERKRRTEYACAAATGTRPDTLYKLIGSKQVGKASITGIRVLHHVRTSSPDRVGVWPFEKIRRSALVEIYPTMFRKIATDSIAKIHTWRDLNLALGKLGSLPVQAPSVLTPSDHETDALISAAGLRHIAADPAVWSPAVPDWAVVLREGWIFGIRQ